MTREISAIDGFSPEAAIKKLIQRYTSRLEKSPLSPEEQGHILDLMNQFSEIAAQLILQQKESIQVTPMNQDPQDQEINLSPPLTFDGPRSRQTITLFCDGVYYTLVKCHKMKMPKDLHVQFAQSVAQRLFEEAKQIVITTYQQESISEPSLSKKDQMRTINKAAHDALLYFVDEYKKASKQEQGGDDS